MPSAAAADFLVIGAGMAGASVAWRLARSGRVVVLEAEHRPGYHSTGRSAAIFDRTYGNETIRALTAASHAFFTAPPAELGIDQPLLTPRGVLYVAREEQRARLEAHFAAIAPLAPDARIHDGAFALERAPILRPGLFTSCLWDGSASDIDVARLQQALLTGLKARGGRWLCDERVKMIVRSSGMWRVETERGDAFEAPVVVNAAGAWADDVASMAGLAPLGLQPKRRSIAVVSLPPGLDPRPWPLTIDIDETWYFKGEAGRLLVSPAEADDVPPCDVAVDDEVLASGIERFEQATTLEVSRITSTWAGLRSFFPDRTPVLGPDPRAPGFHWCAGLGGYGIQTGPAVTDLVAAAIVDPSAVGHDLLRRTSAQRFV